jgi:hypothetical protein
MKHLPVALAALATLVSGCIQVDETLTLEKNGSGNLEIIYSVPEQTISQMKAMFKLREQMAALSGEPAVETREDVFEKIFFDPSEDSIRRELKKYEPLGITISTLKIESRNSARNVNLKVAFTDLPRLSKADFFPDHGFTLIRAQNGNYLFSRAPQGEHGYEVQDFGPGTSGLLSPILGGFRVAIKVTTPGKILETNASRKTLYNAAWVFNYDKDPDAITALQKQYLKIVFDGTGLNLPDVRQTIHTPSKTPAKQPSKATAR